MMPNVVASETIEQKTSSDTINVCQRLLAAEERSLYFEREAVSAKVEPVNKSVKTGKQRLKSVTVGVGG